MKTLKMLSLIAASGAALLTLTTNAVQSGTVYVTECEYMPVNVFTIPLVDTYRSTSGYTTCPETKVTNDWIIGPDGNHRRKTVHYRLFHTNNYLDN